MRLHLLPPTDGAVARGLILSLVLLCVGRPTAAQTSPDGPAAWLHIAPLGGAAVAPPDGGVSAVAGVQLELSRTLPVGLGAAVGWAFTDQDVRLTPDGPWAEVLFSYRFRLRLRGYVSPYAGPIAGVMLDELGDSAAPAADAGARWYFGGRGGVDIPIGSGWPAARVELSYRRLVEEGGVGATDMVAAMAGFRWSTPVGGRRRR